ncbi:g1473 [Coccomyxa elongata]
MTFASQSPADIASLTTSEPAPVSKKPWLNIKRTTEFWSRATNIYVSYKLTQLRAYAAHFRMTEAEIEADIWLPHNQWAGEELYSMCIELRGFYLKVGQFIGTRADFIPKPICKRLALLQDQVPPMSEQQTRGVLEAELGLRLINIFDWIDLKKPLGSASISQVHKAKLLNPRRWANAPKDGIVAVKVQYPDALQVMIQDLSNIRVAAKFLEGELKFDLVSPVDELAKQVRMEFDFKHEALVMNEVGKSLQAGMRGVEVPRSITKLTTQRVLTMSFVAGDPITRLKEKGDALPAAVRQMAAKRLLARVAEAYGRMLLLDGLFQADCHPGNILVKPNGNIGLIDFGQSKQLTEEQRLAFARLVLALSAAGSAELLTVVEALSIPQQQQISVAIDNIGIRLGKGSLGLRVRMAYGMFDTRGRVDPFAKDSPMKAMAVERFPSDFFFVLRVLQILRGMATEMGVFDFSTAVAWKPLAIEALEGPPPLARLAARRWLWAGGLVPGGYPGTGPASLRLGARFGLPKPLLQAAWTAAYAAAAAALSVLWQIPGVNHVALGSLWASHLLAHLAWAKLVTSMGASIASISAGIAVAASSAFAAFWIFRVRPLAGLLLVPYTIGNLVAALLLTTSGLAQETTPPSKEDLQKRPPRAPSSSALPTIKGLPAASVSSRNGSGPPHGSAVEAAREGGNGMVPMDVAVLDTEEASVSVNGAEFRRQNGNARTGQSAGPIRLPISRDVSGRARDCDQITIDL